MYPITVLLLLQLVNYVVWAGTNDTVTVTMRPNVPLTLHCPLEPVSGNSSFNWFFRGRLITSKLLDSWSRFHVFNETKSLYIDSIKRTAVVSCAKCIDNAIENCTELTNFEFVVQNITNIRIPCDDHGNVTLTMSAGGTHVYSCVCDYGYKGPFCEIPFVGKFRLTIVFWVIVISETLAMGFVIYRHMKQTVFRPPADGYRFVDVLNDAYSRGPHHRQEVTVDGDVIGPTEPAPHQPTEEAANPIPPAPENPSPANQ